MHNRSEGQFTTPSTISPLARATRQALSLRDFRAGNESPGTAVIGRTATGRRRRSNEPLLPDRYHRPLIQRSLGANFPSAPSPRARPLMDGGGR